MMWKKMAILALMVTLAGGPVAMAQTTWQVHETGSDDTGDGSPGAPWATISHALAQGAVDDGDSIVLQGQIPDSFTVDKEVAFLGGEILVTGLNSVNNHGIEVQVDNVRFDNVRIYVDKSEVTTTGTILYVGKPDGVSPIENFMMRQQAGIFAYENESAAFMAPPSSGLVLLEIHNPTDSLIHLVELVPGRPTTLNPGAEPDNGLVVHGATPGTSGWGIELRDMSVSAAGSGSSFLAGTGISLQPGTAGMLDGVYITMCNSSWGMTTGIEIRDTEGGANQGITNVEMNQNVTYFNRYGFRIHGMADDTGEGISNVRIFNNQGIWNTLSNEIAGVVFSQDGTGTSNIDFDSVVLRQNAIFNNNFNTTSFAVLNEIPGTTVDARYNYWGSQMPEVGGPGEPTNRISNGVEIIPAFIGTGSSGIILEEIDTPGGMATLGTTGFTSLRQLDIELNAGVTGTFGMVTFNHSTSGYAAGTDGFVGGNWYGIVIQVHTDVPDGEYVMLIQHEFSPSTVTNRGFEPENFVLYYFNESSNWWEPAVNGNTQGTPTWEGDAPVPTSVSATDLGRHGVDLTTNIAWAVVDHTTDYAGGEGLNGQGESPTSVMDWFLMEH